MKTETAIKIANDIAEGIDCGETREELRECINIYADMLAASQERIVTLGNEMMMVGLKALQVDSKLAPAATK